MGDLIKIHRENNNVDALIRTLSESKGSIKDVFCAIRFNDGSLLIIEEDTPFETLCTISKKLDLIIDLRQLEDEEEEYEDDLDGSPT